MSFETKKGFLLVGFIASLMLVVKLWVSYHVYGTNDVTYWMHFADLIERAGTFRVYALEKIYNHPPFISWLLKAITWAASTSALPFPFLLRLLPIFADYASVFLIWHLLEAQPVNVRTLLGVLCSLNPINFLIAAFHGNFDPVLVCCVLLAVYCAQRKRVALAGVCYGLSMCIKLIPVILFPVFLLYFNRKRENIAFLLGSVTVLLIVFLPYLAFDAEAMVRNVFLYRGLKGIWGIPHVLAEVVLNEQVSHQVRAWALSLLRWYSAHGGLVVAVAIIGLSKFFLQQKRHDAVHGVSLAFGSLLALTPGFGVQYLSWWSYFAILVTPVLGTLYTVVGGVFLYRVYTYWGGGTPPYYANSDVVGQWIGVEKSLDLILWVLVVVILVKACYDMVRFKC